MTEHRVNVFFYGSYINFSVLAEAKITERPYQVARLPGYRLVVSPLANLLPDASSEAFGILTRLTHQELDRLYLEHAREKLGGTYLPEAVMVLAHDDNPIPALCYLSHDMEPATPSPAYVDRILNPAKQYGFPADYLEHIASFKNESI